MLFSKETKTLPNPYKRRDNKATPSKNAEHNTSQRESPEIVFGTKEWCAAHLGCSNRIQKANNDYECINCKWSAHASCMHTQLKNMCISCALQTNERTSHSTLTPSPEATNKNLVHPVTADKPMLTGMSSELIEEENQQAIRDLSKNIPQDTSLILQSDSFASITEFDTSTTDILIQEPEKMVDSCSDTSGIEITYDAQIQDILQDVKEYKVLNDELDDSLIQAISVVLGKPIPNELLNEKEASAYLTKCQESCAKLDFNNKTDVKRIKILANVCSKKTGWWKQRTKALTINKLQEFVKKFTSMKIATVPDNLYISRLAEFWSVFFPYGVIKKESRSQLQQDIQQFLDKTKTFQGKLHEASLRKIKTSINDRETAIKYEQLRQTQITKTVQFQRASEVATTNNPPIVIPAQRVLETNTKVQQKPKLNNDISRLELRLNMVHLNQDITLAQ